MFGFLAYVFLGGICLMHTAPSMPMQSMAAHASMECEGCEEESDGASQNAPDCGDGECLSEAADASAIMQAMHVIDVAPATSPVIESIDPINREGLPQAASPPGTPRLTDTIVLLC